MPHRRKRSERAREQLEKFLASKCLICYTPQDTPSKPLPCCGYRIHEDCLLSCFRYAIGNLRDCCPHCQTKITPYNISQPAPRGSNLFCFESVNYPPPPPFKYGKRQVKNCGTLKCKLQMPNSHRLNMSSQARSKKIKLIVRKM